MDEIPFTDHFPNLKLLSCKPQHPVKADTYGSEKEMRYKSSLVVLLPVRLVTVNTIVQSTTKARQYFAKATSQDDVERQEDSYIPERIGSLKMEKNADIQYCCKDAARYRHLFNRQWFSLDVKFKSGRPDSAERLGRLFRLGTGRMTKPGDGTSSLIVKATWCLTS